MLRIHISILISVTFLCAEQGIESNFLQQMLLRLYYINRIKPAINIIKKLTPDRLIVIDKPFINIGGPYEDMTVLQLWDNLKYYNYMHNEQFCSYVFLRVLLVLVKSKNISCGMLHQDHDDIDIEEFLSAIDVVVNYIHQINQHYHNSGLSFSNWLQQYWWLITVIVSGIFIKVLKYYYIDTCDDFYLH